VIIQRIDSSSNSTTMPQLDRNHYQIKLSSAASRLPY